MGRRRGARASAGGGHRGATTMTRCPRAASAMGSEPTTSPRPPVLLQGATSADTNTMSSGRSACCTPAARSPPCGCRGGGPPAACARWRAQPQPRRRSLGPSRILLETRPHGRAAPPLSILAVAPVTATFNPGDAATSRRSEALCHSVCAPGGHPGAASTVRARRCCAAWCLLAHCRPCTGCAAIARAPLSRGAAGGCLAGRSLRRVRLACAHAQARDSALIMAARRAAQESKAPCRVHPLHLAGTPEHHFQPQACLSKRGGCADHLPETRRWKCDL